MSPHHRRRPSARERFRARRERSSKHGRYSRGRGRRGHRLQSKLFWWFGATISLTGAAVFAMHAIFGSAAPDFERARDFVAERLGESWDDPAERREYAKGIHEVFHLNVSLVDAAGHTLESFGDACSPLKSWTIPIVRDDRLAGTVVGCWPAGSRGSMVLITVLAACVVLWAASSVIARRITRPLTDLVRVTREIGAGKLSSRVGLGRHHAGEIGVLADAVNDMAVRIERQMRDQRELLAAVSHEIRSPLARLRVLAELARNGDGAPDAVAKIEREVLEIDALVGKLLASSRIDFDALSPQRLLARDVALRELERAGLGAELLRDESDGAGIEADATLLGRALGNLIENAVRHAGGVEGLAVEKSGAHCVFSVEDAGPGFSKEMLTRAFDAFYRGGGASSVSDEARVDAGSERSSLGLGLALVERIARAHGGRAWVENRAGKGASAKLGVPLARELT